MEEFSRLRHHPETFKFKDLKSGKYNLVSLRKISTKFGYCVFVKLCVDIQEKKNLLRKFKKFSEKLIHKINIDNYKFNYDGMNNGKYECKIEIA